jgi:uncharacterized protein YdeI (YjbR/CyaY-like superfamily)
MRRSMAPAKIVSKSFSVNLEAMPGRLRWVIAYVPLDPTKVWGSRRVRGEINGFAFRTSLFPARDGRHFLLVNKTMQKGACVRPGDNARVRLENDLEQRTAEIPAELEREFRQSKALRRWFENLSLSIRKDIVARVLKPKSQEARKRQAGVLAEVLYSAMDAERDLPPFLRAAFSLRPRAYEGWQRMSPTQRRHHLLGIFYYRGVEARQRRIEKMLADAEARVEKSRA